MAAHGGGEGKNAMLQLFEGYLERKVLEDMDEAAYDHVREGAVVFLGTLARHLEPSGPKVRRAGACPGAAHHEPAALCCRAL